MNESVAYTLSRFFLYAAYTTPLISFLIVRKKEKKLAVKLLIAVILTIVLAGVFLLMAMWLLLMSGEVS
jgi:amino acid transporter